MDIKALQVFLTVCGNLSFTQTAKELHMSVSAVSRTIQRIEEDLDTPLFDRDRRGMRLTPSARQLRTTAERMVSDWRGLRQALGHGKGVRGELRVFCSVTATHELLSPLLSAYRQSYPGVEVLLQTGDQADGVERVRQGSADAAVIAKPPQLAEQLTFKRLTHSELCLCMPGIERGAMLQIEGQHELELIDAVGQCPWILPERGVSERLINDWLLERYTSRPNVYARVAGHEAIVAMVSLGLGVGVVPRLVIEASGLASKLRLVTIAEIPPMEIGLCTRAGRLSDPVLSGLWRVAQGVTDDSDKLSPAVEDRGSGR